MLNSSANKFLFNLVQKKPIYIFTSLILSLSSAILNTIGTILLIPILAILLGNGEQMILPSRFSVLKHLLSLLANYTLDNQLLLMIVLTFLTISLKNVINYFNTIINLKYNKYLAYQMRADSLDLLCQVNLDYYQQNKLGDILLKFNREIDRTVLAVKSGQTIFIISTTILAFVSLLTYISWQLSLLSASLLSLVFLLNNFIISQARKSRFSLAQQSKLYSRRLVELLTGIRLVKATVNETEEYQIITKLIKQKNKIQFSSQAITAIINPMTEIVGLVIILILVFVSRYLYSREIQQFAPVLLIYLAILLRLLPFIGQLNNARTQFVNNIPSVEIIASFLDLADKPILASGNITLTTLKSSIKFHNVTFAYPHQAQIVLDKVTLSIPKGKIVAIVGSSSSGKSTIANLLTRFYDPIEGQVLLDQKDLRKYQVSSLRKIIGVVGQSSFLFNNSLAYNLTYGIKNISEVDIMTAAKNANIDKFINQLPEGLTTKVGEYGITLSEEQKQRIAIARAFLQDPQILILDEPTKNLDLVSQQLIQAAIIELCRDRTTLMISNRFDLIKQADQIVVLNQGKILETGTHQELLQHSSFYHRFYSMQFKSSQQSHQQKLTQKIAKKLAYQASSNLSTEIHDNLNSLLDSLEQVNQGLFENDLEEHKIIDESYQSAKDMLASLREYERKISRGFNNTK